MDIQEYIRSGIIDSCILGIADEQDIAELQRLKRVHPEIAAAVAAMEGWLEQYAQAHAVPVSDDVKIKTLAALSPDRLMVHKRIRVYQYVAAASLFLLIASAALTGYYHRKYAAIEKEYAIVSNPRVLKVPLSGVAGKEDDLVTLYWNTTSKEVYLRTDKLPQAPAGQQYQLWAIVDGKPVDAGVLDDRDGDRLLHLKPVAKAQAFAITLEQNGGSPTPTLSRMFVLGKLSS